MVRLGKYQWDKGGAAGVLRSVHDAMVGMAAAIAWSSSMNISDHAIAAAIEIPHAVI